MTADAGSFSGLTVIGAGGQGTVYAVPDRLINNSWPAAYKEYEFAVRPALDESALIAMVDFRRQLGEAQARRLDELTAWPAEVVERDGRISGFLMRRAPVGFRIGLRMSRGPVEHLAQVQLLLNDETYLTGRGLMVDDRFRLELLSDIAESMRFLHELGVVVGDLSPNNLLFSRAHRPRCFFIDCDAMRLRGASALRQAETIDWQAPPGDERVATPATDSYKFALLCIRLFAGDQSTRDPIELSRAGPAMRLLAVRALSVDPRRRPTMADWHEALAAVKRPPANRPAPLAPQAARRLIAAISAAVLLALLLCLLPRLAGCDTWTRSLGGAVSGAGARASEQASGVAQLLADSGRGQVPDAVSQIAACTNLQIVAADLRTASAARAAAVERARSLQTDQLSRGDELKNQILAALDHARRADDAYARWATDMEASDCQSVRSTDRRRGDAESVAATAAAKRVAELWNPLAARYDHPAMSYSDL